MEWMNECCWVNSNTCKFDLSILSDLLLYLMTICMLSLDLIIIASVFVYSIRFFSFLLFFFKFSFYAYAYLYIFIRWDGNLAEIMFGIFRYLLTVVFPFGCNIFRACGTFVFRYIGIWWTEPLWLCQACSDRFYQKYLYT